MFNRNKNKKVVVAMSGGVDSSVSAALLKKAGYDVVGIFMKCWSTGQTSTGLTGSIGCTSEEDELWARRAADKIVIPFYGVDLVDEYKKRVVDYFVHEYKEGRTPNPDVMCNDQIKFGVFFDKTIKEFDANYVATGHYARIKKDKKGCHLLIGVDPEKDQSYFLYRLKQNQLQKTLFPIGDYKKSEVRKLANKFGLPNAEKKDSQGLCFIGKVDIKEFLKEYIPQKEGDVVTTLGKKIGKHKGAYYYTIGQRQGIGIGGGTPYYIVDKDTKTNTLTVGPRYDEALLKKSVNLEDLSWTNKEPKFPGNFTANIRYHQEHQKVFINKEGKGLVLEFKESQRAVTSGQSCVIYKNEEVLGGGIIM